MKSKISALKILESNAGFYIGRTEIELDGSEQPYSRDSVEYYNTRSKAYQALTDKTYTPRMEL